MCEPDSVGAIGSLVDIEGADAGRDHVKVVGEQEARHVMLDFEFNAHFLLSEIRIVLSFTLNPYGTIMWRCSAFSSSLCCMKSCLPSSTHAAITILKMGRGNI